MNWPEGFLPWLARNLSVTWLAIASCCPASLAGEQRPLAEGESLRLAVARASASSSRWDGPVAGPPARPAVVVAVVCEDLRNGGVLGVARGIIEAGGVLGWRIRILDAHGTPAGRTRALAAALDMAVDGLVLVGSDARSLNTPLASFAARGIPVVGWHVGPRAGGLAQAPVAMNVSTDPLEVARVAAMAAIIDTPDPKGMVIFTDTSFDIATAKSDAMARLVRSCGSCRLLETRALPISRIPQDMPRLTRELLARHGSRWTHALAINDLYFDYAAPELTQAGRALRLVSAGDGSPAAFQRIQAGMFQIGTVAEPLNLQGWQLLDELNRLLSGQSVTGHVHPPHLVTPDNIGNDGGQQLQYDPDNGYRLHYRRIWRPEGEP
ncbi:MAG: substrate-binding domain-containing protein [Pseudomonadota bacterium]